MIKKNIIINYTAKKDERFDKAFKPLLFVNGKWVYTTARCKKTMNGAIKTAKKLAEEYATQYPSLYNNVAINQK